MRDSESVARTESERYAEAASHVKNLSSQMSTNINDEVLEHVGQQLFDGNKEAGMRWQSLHGEKFRSYAEDYLKASGFNQAMADMVAQKDEMTPETIEANWQKAKDNISGDFQERRGVEQGSLSEKLATQADQLGVSEQKARVQDGDLRKQSEQVLLSEMERRFVDQLEERRDTQEKIDANTASVSQKAEDARGTAKVVRMVDQLNPGASIKEELQQASEKIGD